MHENSDFEAGNGLAQALSESDVRLRSAFEHAGVGLAVLDITGRFVETNRVLQQMLGYTVAEFEAMTMASIIHPEDLPHEQALLMASLSGKTLQPCVMEQRYLAKDGRILWAKLTMSFVRDERGLPLYGIGVIEDITTTKQSDEERRKLDERLRYTQKMESLCTLAGGIAHDFNNLLMGILGNAGFAMRELPASAQARSHISEIERAAWRAAELSRQMLAFSGKGRFIVEPVDLGRLLADVLPLVDASISRRAAFHLDCSRELPLVAADAAQLNQVVISLVTNAAEAFADRRGHIAIATGCLTHDGSELPGSFPKDPLPAGAYVFLEVRDDGCGMDTETQARIFDPFFTTKFTGRGLGLAAVIGIVRGHKGAVEVRSAAGSGTTIRVLLPALPEQTTDSARITTPGGVLMTWSGNETALVVDDEPMVLSVTQLMLEQIGFKVLTARDGDEAIAVFRDHANEIAFVLLDLTMPRMSGGEAYQRLVALKPGLKVILSSGYSETEARGQLAADGLAGFVQKPYKIETMRKVIKRALFST